MKTYLENELSKDALQFWDETLEAQIQFSGTVELPYLLSKIRQRKPARIIDIGTGNGAFLLRIAQEFPEIHFVGIDHNQGLLELFKKKLAKAGLQNVEIQESYFDTQGLAQAEEFIFERYTLGHVSDPAGFCRGVFRSLRPGGVFYSFGGAFSVSKNLASGLWKEVIEKYFEVFSKWGTQPDIGLSLPEHLRAAGFEGLDTMIRLCTPAIAGDSAFQTATLKTMTMFHKQFPEIVPASFVARVEAELLNYQNAKFPPCIANVQTEAFRPS
jgi:trans-aconitate 2-methyltransferase